MSEIKGLLNDVGDPLFEEVAVWDSVDPTSIRLNPESEEADRWKEDGVLRRVESSTQLSHITMYIALTIFSR